MKQIQNKETTIVNVDEKRNPIGNCHYSNLIRLVIDQGKQGGLDYTDIENRLAISKAIKDDPETIELEDAVFGYLRKLVELMRWVFYHEDLLSFKNDIIAIK